MKTVRSGMAQKSRSGAVSLRRERLARVSSSSALEAGSRSSVKRGSRPTRSSTASHAPSEADSAPPSIRLSVAVLTRERSASSTRVHRRARRACLTKAPRWCPAASTGGGKGSFLALHGSYMTFKNDNGSVKSFLRGEIMPVKLCSAAVWRIDDAIGFLSCLPDRERYGGGGRGWVQF